MDGWIYSSWRSIRINKEVKLIQFKNGPASKGTIYIHNEDQIKRVKKDKLQEYLDNGWKLGMRDKSK